ncbi:hypothetical protein F2P81_026072 [Scophthalmus maximus]|uniref:Uncharacterized protein n=1 Tax=Scophthalmus maximus TaxID=52904 RepID=A0A6A4RMW7_SCOMX|nr:hypothetical protein F2P81_026072 [Scophthalmus maximus]
MLKVLEKGVVRANDMGNRRIVICVDGLRSDNLPWEEAEKIAVAAVKLKMKMPNILDGLKELVIVTSESQDKHRRDQVLATVRSEREERSRSRDRSAKETWHGLTKMEPLNTPVQQKGCEWPPETLAPQFNPQREPLVKDPRSRTRNTEPLNPGHRASQDKKQ